MHVEVFAMLRIEGLFKFGFSSFASGLPMNLDPSTHLPAPRLATNNAAKTVVDMITKMFLRVRPRSPRSAADDVGGHPHLPTRRIRRGCAVVGQRRQVRKSQTASLSTCRGQGTGVKATLEDLVPRAGGVSSCTARLTARGLRQQDRHRD